MKPALFQKLTCAVVAACLFATLLPAVAFAGLDSTLKPGWDNKYWGCNRVTEWAGWISPNAGSVNDQPVGTFQLCFSVYRLIESDPTGDTYAVDGETTWKQTSGAHYWDNPATFKIYSNIAAQTNNYKYTQTVTVQHSCSTLPSIGIGVPLLGGPGPTLGVSVTPVLCNDEYLYNTSGGTTGASWRVNDVANSPFVETVWLEKVTEGAKPFLQYTLGYPYYLVSCGWYSGIYSCKTTNRNTWQTIDSFQIR